MYEVTIGQDLSCYATIQIPEDTPLTRETLTEIVNHVLDNQEWKGEDVYMEEDWSSVCAARVVSVRDKKGNHLVEDIAIDPSPYDAGQTLMGWLRRYGPTLETVINSAAQARLIDDPVMEAHCGTLKLPGAAGHRAIRQGAIVTDMARISKQSGNLPAMPVLVFTDP